MAKLRRSKYKKPAAAERVAEPRFAPGDLALLQLYGPEHGYDLLSADLIALLLGKNHKYMQHRVQALWHWNYLERWFPPRDYRQSGSPKAIYFPSRKGKTKLDEHYARKVTVKYVDPNEYHPFLPHTALRDRVRAITSAAIAHHPDLELLYHFKDGEFIDSFSAEKAITRNGTTTYQTVQYNVQPDWFFGLGRSLDLPVLNFPVECQRSKARAVKSPKKAKRSLRKKYEALYYAYKKERWREWVKIKPVIRDPKNWRSLTVCDMQEQEFENLITSVRDLDERGVGLRLTYFIRLQDLEERISIVNERYTKSGKVVRERVITKDSLMHFFDPIWRTPQQDDALQSILT